MGKVKLGRIAKFMYDLQEYCAFNFWEIEKSYQDVWNVAEKLNLESDG